MASLAHSDNFALLDPVYINPAILGEMHCQSNEYSSDLWPEIYDDLQSLSPVISPSNFRPTSPTTSSDRPSNLSAEVFEAIRWRLPTPGTAQQPIKIEDDSDLDDHLPQAQQLQTMYRRKHLDHHRVRHAEAVLTNCQSATFTRFQTRKRTHAKYATVYWYLTVHDFLGIPTRLAFTDDQLPWNVDRYPNLFATLEEFHGQGEHRWRSGTFPSIEKKPLWKTHPFLKEIFHFCQPL